MIHPIVRQDIRSIAKNIKKEAKALEGKTLLISGGAGFLGRYIVGTIHHLNKEYFKKPCTILVVDNFITGIKNRLYVDGNAQDIKVIEQNVIKPFTVEGPIDYIIHAAGLASPVYYQKYPIETIESAIFGAKNLLELARAKKVKSFLFFSSSEIYGDPDPNFIPTPETYHGNVSCIGSRACYDESKRLGETLTMTYHDVYGIPVKIVRPFNIFGPGMRQDDFRVVPTFIGNALRGKMLPVHDEGNQTRTFCYISDATVAFLKVLLSSKKAEVSNVGNDENEINMMSLAQIVAELFDNKIEINKIEYPASYPKDEPRRRSPDLTKIRTQLHYRPEVDLRQGLKRTIDWFRAETGKSQEKRR